MILRGSHYSPTLEMDTGLTLVLPREPRDQPPAACYLYHGLGAGSGSLTEDTLLPAYAEEYNVVFVMPEVGRSYYLDLRYGQKFFTYVADELPDLIRRRVIISAAREDTAVVGVSMGGNGALRTAFARPDRFGACCAISSGLLYMKQHIERLKKMDNWEAVARVYGPQRVNDFRCMFGEELDVRPEQQVLHWAAHAAARPDRPRLSLACGTEDPFRKDNRRFRDELVALGYEACYEEWPGGHDTAFFTEALRRALAFCFAPRHAVAARPMPATLPEE